MYPIQDEIVAARHAIEVDFENLYERVKIANGGLWVNDVYTEPTGEGPHVLSLKFEAADVIRMLLNLRTEFIPDAFAAAVPNLPDDGYAPKLDAARLLSLVHALAGCVSPQAGR